MTTPPTAREVWAKRADFYDKVETELQREKANSRKIVSPACDERRAKVQRAQDEAVLAAKPPVVSPDIKPFLDKAGAAAEFERLQAAKKRVEDLVREKKRGQFHL